MKIISKHINWKTRTFVRIALEIDTDDAWNLYNLIQIGDFTFDFDAESDTIRITGTNAAENKYLKLGQYQSLEIQAPKTLTLIKPQFDIIHLKKLSDASDLQNLGHVCVIVMEEGIAHLFLVGKNTSKLKAKVEKRISKKKAYASQHDKQKNKFFENVLQALMQHFIQGQQQLKSIVIGSPGFVKDAFYAYIKQESDKAHNVFMKQCIEKIILTHTSSGFKHSLNEVMSSKTVQDKIKDLSVFSESIQLDKFFEILSMDPDKVCYGYKSVDYAMKSSAVDTFLISDKLFRAKNVVVRLDNLSGVAAILRYPLAGIDDIEEDDIDIDELIEQEGEQRDEEQKQDETKEKKLTWDEQQLEILLGNFGDQEEEDEEEEIVE
ncbi:protein pelota homolog [Stylonychia lemnae]|uniref:Eukaryotic peptide chain release factor subunit 1 n=1 Tax=Stylonychia lemnae TaxID=5949 RepID=A0A078A1A0_STYLE|nr:protein pelota homolog [Stylonychia lemnae]|eukprot:CDW74559.1 protein pelota homolog [Stylonychia lemnae]